MSQSLKFSTIIVLLFLPAISSAEWGKFKSINIYRKDLYAETESIVWKFSKRSFKTKDCKKGYDKLLNIKEQKKIVSAPISIGFLKLYLPNKRTISLFPDLCEYTNGYTQGDIFLNFEFLSFIGPLLSYQTEIGVSENSGSYHGYRWKTINSMTGSPISILDVFTAKSVQSALIQDSWIKNNISYKPNSSVNLYDLIPKKGLGFAIYDYDKSKKLYAVRVGFIPNHAMYNMENITQVGLWLKPKREWEKPLKNTIFLMKDKKKRTAYNPFGLTVKK